MTDAHYGAMPVHTYEIRARLQDGTETTLMARTPHRLDYVDAATRALALGRYHGFSHITLYWGDFEPTVLDIEALIERHREHVKALITGFKVGDSRNAKLRVAFSAALQVAGWEQDQHPTKDRPYSERYTDAYGQDTTSNWWRKGAALLARQTLQAGGIGKRQRHEMPLPGRDRALDDV